MPVQQLNCPVPAEFLLEPNQIDFSPKVGANSLEDSARIAGVLLTPNEVALQHLLGHFKIPNNLDVLMNDEGTGEVEGDIRKRLRRLQPDAWHTPNTGRNLGSHAWRPIGAFAYVLLHPDRDSAFDIPAISEGLASTSMQLNSKAMQDAVWFAVRAVQFAPQLSEAFSLSGKARDEALDKAREEQWRWALSQAIRT